MIETIENEMWGQVYTVLYEPEKWNIDVWYQYRELSG